MSELNCRPGDLAVVVSGFPEANIGKIVRCVEICEFSSAWRGETMWLYDGWLISAPGVRSLGVADCCLRPIRDPGEDAVDEMLMRVGAPDYREVAA